MFNWVLNAPLTVNNYYYSFTSRKELKTQIKNKTVEPANYGNCICFQKRFALCAYCATLYT